MIALLLGIEVAAHASAADVALAPDATPGPTPGAPTTSLAEAVRRALAHSFQLQDGADGVASARWRERAARDQFLPRLLPFYQRFEDRSAFGLDVAQAIPWLGASVSGSGRVLSDSTADSPFAKTSDLRVLLTQPLLRGFGPNASLFTLRNARRSRVAQERALALARQRVAVEVAAAFYDVTAQRQLLEVARQSLSRTEALLGSSTARLEVGMASKLDVFRAELQAAQARDALLRSEASLATALERFRGLLALPPGEPLEPEAAALPQPETTPAAPLEELVALALAHRLELQEAREQIDDARRAAGLARQNLLPQLDLNLSLTQNGVGGSFGDAWSAGERRLEVFLSTSYPLQQADARAGRAVAELQLAGRERALRQLELELEQQVRRAARDLEQLRKSVALQRRAVEIAAQQRRLAVLRYERGLGSNFDVVDAEGSLVTARSALVQQLAAFASSLLDLKRTTGTLDPDAEFEP